MKEGIVPRFYTAIIETPDPEKLDDIPGVEVVDTVDDMGILLVELTQQGSLSSLLTIRRRGYQLSHAINIPLASSTTPQK